MASVIHSQSCHRVVDWIPLSIDEINYLDGVIYALMQTRQANPYRNAKLHQRVLPSLQSWFVMLPLTVLPTEGREQYYPVPPISTLPWLISVMEKGLDNALLYSFAIVKAETQCDRLCRDVQSIQDWALSQIEGCDNYRTLYGYYTTLATYRQPLLDKIKQCRQCSGE